jgi:D-alanine-D-alanine ligase-like ATP-grasp enzyme
MNIKSPKIYTTLGPSLTVPYKAIILEYENFEVHDDFAVSGKEKDYLRSILPETIIDKINFNNIKNIDDLLVELMRAFIDSRDTLNLRIDLKTNDKNNKLICVEYLYQEQLTPPINAAFGITSQLKSDLAVPQQQLNDFINQVTQNSLQLAPLMALKNMLQGANLLQIPFYPIDALGGLFSYGQGKNSIFFDFASSQFDSHVGATLQTDKTKTNMLLKRLGYSTTEQRVANSIEKCHEAAKQLGAPLVIKPLNGAKGIGVTANISHYEQIAEAYKVANQSSDGQVIVEKFIKGDAHRLTVSNGAMVKDVGVTCVYPPFITGDGENNILKLIEIENDRRDTPDHNELTLHNITLNEKMKSNLQHIGMDENSIPEKSLRVNLLHTSNAISGGKIILVDEKDIHPDNLKMAIDITRLFKLNCSGIDYITPDISRSWREVGAVIEVNYQPGVGKMLADGILKSHFSDKNNGLIDSTLVITNNDKFAQKIIKERNNNGAKVGYANAKVAKLDDEVKRTAQDDLYDNCRCLLIHPDCEEIVVSMTSNRIVEFGLPLDYFDQSIIDPDCLNDTTIKEVRSFLKNHVGQILNV